jgi:CHAD domain-containing protein
MAFHLTEGERLPEGLRRIAIEQIDRARTVLTDSDVDRDTAIHTTRKCFKKLRALLRLVREEIGDDLYSYENRFFRDCARSLAGQRDVASVAEAVERLIESTAEESEERRLLSAVRDELAVEMRKMETQAMNLDDVINDVLARLEEARERAEQWPLERDRFTAIDRGLKRIYRNGRKAYGVITGDPTDDNLHEWRKEAKYLWYSVRMLEPVWPEVLEAMVHELHALSDLLGDDHDLSLLRAIIIDRPFLVGADEDAALLLALIDTRRAAMQDRAKSLGSRIYSERPKAFITRMRTYWKAWRGEGVV